MPGTEVGEGVVVGAHIAGDPAESIMCAAQFVDLTGAADSFCTITSSNLPAIVVGSRIVYLEAAGATAVDSDVVLVVRPGDFALGHVVLSRVTHLGVITFSGGTGKFRWFHARAIVNTSIQPVSVVGDYHFRPGAETKES